MSRHTPGPWIYDYAPSGTQFMVTTPDHTVIAFVGADLERDVIGAAVEANARLIAAAPELYEALNAMLERFGVMSDGCIKMASDAISKAEGRS